MTSVQTVIVEQDDAGIRLDRWFKRYHPSINHGLLQKWLRTGQVRIDGKRAKANARLKAGQIIRVPPGATYADDEPRVVPRQVSVSDADRTALIESILYQDEDVIAINKPAGLAVQGGSKTLHHLDAMLDHLQFDTKERPRLVHRLDKDTSGVLMLARTRSASTYLSQLFSSRSLQKTYWALVVGVPKNHTGLIQAPLLKGEGQGGEKMIVNLEEGKPAETHYRVIDTVGQKVAWLELEPKTGRTHQLRVHCDFMGIPILGDGKYGGSVAYLNGVPNTRKIHLHAYSISLALPNGILKRIEAPLSSLMVETWKHFGFDVDDSRGSFAKS
jgi:23S rRNA pseudouridine955/2504/2580 synthase